MRDRRLHYIGYEHYMRSHCLIITDYEWLCEHEAAIQQWLAQCVPAAQVEGCIVLLPTEGSVTLFLARWM